MNPTITTMKSTIFLLREKYYYLKISYSIWLLNLCAILDIRRMHCRMFQLYDHTLVLNRLDHDVVHRLLSHLSPFGCANALLYRMDVAPCIRRKSHQGCKNEWTTNENNISYRTISWGDRWSAPYLLSAYDRFQDIAQCVSLILEYKCARAFILIIVG